MTPNPFTRRGLREDKKRWRIGLPGACGLCTCSRSGVTLVSWDQEFSTDPSVGPQAARKAERQAPWASHRTAEGDAAWPALD